MSTFKKKITKLIEGLIKPRNVLQNIWNMIQITGCPVHFLLQSITYVINKSRDQGLSIQILSAAIATSRAFQKNGNIISNLLHTL